VAGLDATEALSETGELARLLRVHGHHVDPDGRQESRSRLLLFDLTGRWQFDQPITPLLLAMSINERGLQFTKNAERKRATR